jgi:EmrB/QacA subfamily drug resistance transporter
MTTAPIDEGHPDRWKALVVLAAAQVLIMLDLQIVNTAIPAIARAFEASSATLQWIVDSYALIFAGLLLLAGALGDRFGRRRVLFIGLVAFIASSLGAAAANSANMLIVMRALQGVSAALVMPQTLSIITAIFPRHERARALGIWAGAMGLGTAGGPLLGGALVDNISWSAVFWVPVPVALFTIAGLRVTPESRSAGDNRLDLPGALFGTAAIFALVYAIIEGHAAGWGSPLIVAAFAVAGGSSIAFIAAERVAPNPIVPLRFFKQRDFNGSVIGLFLVFFALMGMMFFLAQYFQLVQGESAFRSGLNLLPTAIGMTIMAPITGRLIPIVGPKILLTLAGLSGMGVLLWFSRLDVDSGYLGIGIGLFVFGLGGGMAIPTISDTTMAAVPVNEAGRASGVSNTGRQIGGALGIAVLGTIAATIYSNSVSTDLAGVLPGPLVAQIADGIGAAAVIARQSDPQIALLIREAANPAFVDAITSVFAIGAVFMGLAALSSILLIPMHMRTHQMSDAPVAPTPAISRETSAGVPLDVPRAAWQDAVLEPRGQKSTDMGIAGGD